MYIFEGVKNKYFVLEKTYSMAGLIILGGFGLVFLIVYLRSRREDEEFQYQATEYTKDYIQKAERENLEKYLEYFDMDKLKYVCQPIDVELAGAKHYKDPNLGFLFKKGEQVLLFHEPENQFDEHAVKVLNLRGQHIGYVPSFEAKDIGEDLANKIYYDARISTIIDDLIYPSVYMTMIKHSDKEEYEPTDEEVAKTVNALKARREAQAIGEEKSTERYRIGRELEREGKVDLAVDIYNSIVESEYPIPAVYIRLAMNFRKKKDYSAEIEILNDCLKCWDNASCNLETINYEKSQVQKRIDRAQELKSKIEQ